MENQETQTDTTGAIPAVPSPATCSEVDQLRRALKETTDALVHAFCWGDGPLPFEEINGGRWDGVRALVEANAKLLSPGTAWIYESSPNS